MGWWLALVPLVPVVWTVGFVLWMQVRFLRYAWRVGLTLPTRTPWQWCVVLGAEAWALLHVQSWHVHLPWSARSLQPNGGTREHAVVCVHGFSQNGTNFRRLRKRLQAEGRASFAVNLGYPPRSAERYADRLADALKGIAAATGEPVDVVCHSMGGVVLRVALQRHPDVAPLLCRVVTVATPHQGTASARGVPLPETRFMGRRSEALARLPDLASLAPGATLTSLGSIDDTTVYPVQTTREPGATHLELVGLGHAGILFYDTALTPILRALSEPTSAQPQPATKPDNT